MAYVINRWNGTAITTVEDGTVDQTLDIKLVGKNYAGYGEIQNETFVHMLENFAGTQSPSNALSGQIWFDSTSKKLKFYTGDQIAGQKVWKTAGGVEYGTEPSNPTTGDLWFDTTKDQLKVRKTGTWLTIGPQSAGTGTTQMVSRLVTGTDAVQHSIIVAIINDEPVYIISKDEFTIDISLLEPGELLGFITNPVIKKGLTLPNTNPTTGVSSTSHVYWGTARNAEYLGGVPASSYVQSGLSSFTNVVRFSDLGYTVGDGNDLAVYIQSGTEPIIENQTGPKIYFKVKDGSTVKSPLTINTSSVEPGVTASFTLGAPSKVWSNVYATTFTGSATQANSLLLGASYVTASTSAAINSIAARNGSGDINANLFVGIATSARYADLAEKYLADEEYEVGTVVAVGGNAEVTAANYGERAIGVVSANPAFMMNKDLEGGTYIALKGRVPVKVIGPITKGQRLVSANSGVATVATSHTGDVFAIALESSDSVEIKLVECVIL